MVEFAVSSEAKNSSWFMRPMRNEDIDRCLDIWRQVKLTEAHSTVSSCLSADPHGFWVAEMEDSGLVVGMCTGTFTRSDTVFMGFYAVDPSYQKMGIGKALWARTLERLDSSINVGLYGVPTMSAKYERSGFVVDDVIRMLVFESNSETGKEGLNMDCLANIADLPDCHIETINSKTSDTTFKRLVDYDHGLQRFSREKLLKLYLQTKDCPLTVALIRGSGKTRVCNHPACDQHFVNAQQSGSGDRKSSCCAKPPQESIIEGEALKTTSKTSLSTSATNLGEVHMRSPSPVDIPVVCTGNAQNCELDPANRAQEIIGYGCVRHDNNGGGMIGPVYADSSQVCEVILRTLIERFPLKVGHYFSVMSLNSSNDASKILNKLGLEEKDQCTRKFTKFVPAASFSKIYYVHSPNFTLF